MVVNSHEIARPGFAPVLQFTLDTTRLVLCHLTGDSVRSLHGRIRCDDCPDRPDRVGLHDIFGFLVDQPADAVCVFASTQDVIAFVYWEER